MPKRQPIMSGMLDNFITATRPTVTENRYGDLEVTDETTVATFWGDIKEIDSISVVENGKKRITRTIRITARENDVEAVELDDILTFGNSDDEYQVNDFFEADWRYGRVLIANTKD